MGLGVDRDLDLTVGEVGNKTRWEVALTRDIDGYSIGPHADGKRKWITSIYYLAKQGDGNEASGTYVLEKSPESGAPADGTVGWEGYTVSERVKFVPNSAFVFAPCASAWHAVPEVPLTGSTVRDTLQAFIKSRAGFDTGLGECPTTASRVSQWSSLSV